MSTKHNPPSPQQQVLLRMDHNPECDTNHTESALRTIDKAAQASAKLPTGGENYVRKLLEAYRNTPGTSGSLRRPDRLLAVQLHQRGIPLKKVESALVLAAVRRLIRPPDAPPLTMVRSLAYFLPVIEEVLQMEVGEEYFQYARQKLQRLSNVGQAQTADGPCG
jgi:hypothetical protein